ncbi:MAG: aminodeoxychorismate synthase component I [Candidatus Omnitrophota bacterium]
MYHIEEIKNAAAPKELFESMFKNRAEAFFLESGMDHCGRGRFSCMGAEPFLVVKSKGRLVEIFERSPVTGHQSPVKRVIGNPFLMLQELLKKYANQDHHDEIPFLGGAVGYFSYDLCHFLEELPSTAIDDIQIPDIWVGFYDDIVAVDHTQGRTYKIRLDIRGGCRTTSENPPLLHSITSESGSHEVTSNFLKESYIAAVRKAMEYIRNGDIYQVNLSQRFEAPLTVEPFELYERLRAINPAPFAAYLDCGEAQIISSSPERFLKVDAKSRVVETRPIKGTRQRGRTGAEDRELIDELAASAKDRAEHIMIVDLERNDLGRICEYGSIELAESMVSEQYATVHHLVSTITGRLRADVDVVDCLMQCFPGGSITGAPKIRSMEIIDELEPTKRSVYTGALGYIGFNGAMDLNIAIRTFIARRGKVYFQAGGGIVADSDPEAEYQETLDKAQALFDALGPGFTAKKRQSVKVSER